VSTPSSDFSTRLSQIAQLDSLNGFYTLAQDLFKYFLSSPRQLNARKTPAQGYQYELWTLNGKALRPINTELFWSTEVEFRDGFQDLQSTLERLSTTSDRASVLSDNFVTNNGIERTIYTIQQCLAFGSDLFMPANQARKLVGISFEQVVALVLQRLGLYCSPVILDVPLGIGNMKYSSSQDLLISREPVTRTRGRTTIDPDDVLCSIKTSSKDRGVKTFVEKRFIERASGSEGSHVKYISIVFNDVQRSERRSGSAISATFVPYLFLACWLFLSRFDGVYYVDLPFNVESQQTPWNDKMFRLSRLLTTDLWTLLR
jgi:hypothetical protein